MPLPVPNLDDRKFQDILDEARQLIPVYCPEWTNHSLNDPGITLLELFAFMADLLLYRLNRVPDRNYLNFMELIGVHLESGSAATTDLTFYLSAPQPEDLQIPRGTSVGTLRTQTRESVIFTTHADLIVRVPQLAWVLANRGGTFVDLRTTLNATGRDESIFSDSPLPDDSIYFGFDNDLSGHVLRIEARVSIASGAGIDPTDPPLGWETWDRIAGQWVALAVEVDTTRGLNTDGIIMFRLPYSAAPFEVFGQTALWVRCRLLAARPGQGTYLSSPRIRHVQASSLGGQVPAGHASRVTGEVLGISNGAPGQQFRLKFAPILPRGEGETLEVEPVLGEVEWWQEVADFADSTRYDRHFTIDGATGTVEFGPRIRSPRGEELQHGAVPPAGSRLRFSSYRTGGGLIGNVGARTLVMLLSSIPYVSSVTNIAPAVGGLDPETLEHARWRAPSVLRGIERAVTSEDFEVLARQASPGVGRAHCLAVRDSGDATLSVVRVQLVPAVSARDEPLSLGDLELSERVLQDVREYLNDRRLLTCQLQLEPATYTWVSVVARIRGQAGVDTTRLTERAAHALYRYIHPTVGGSDGQGWPFGRELFQGEIFAILQSIEGVDVVEEVALHEVTPPAGPTGSPLNRIAAPNSGVLCSYEHNVQVV